MTPIPIIFEGRDGLCFYERRGFRPPKKGEFYLSGAIVQAWQAHHDFTAAFQIVRPIFSAERRTVWVRGAPIEA